MTILYFED